MARPRVPFALGNERTGRPPMNTKFMAFAFLLFFCPLLVTCEEAPRHITGSEFRYEYEMRNGQTMHYAKFAGEREGKVFLVKKAMSTMNPEKWSEEVLFTEVSGLDPDFLKKIRLEAGRR